MSGAREGVARAAAPARPGPEDPFRAEIPFTDADFARIAAFAHTAFGLSLPPGKKDLVYSRLVRRLRRIGCSDFAAYCALLEGPRGEEERAALVSALTTNVTHFFREEHHFHLLRDSVLRPLADGLRQGRRLRLWSAGCSAGPEPYSLAMTVLDSFPDAPRLNLRILATDVDRAILARAEAGAYSEDELRGLTPAQRRHYFDRMPAGGGRVTPALRGMIRFAELNLMGQWPLRGPFDAIFCRNVAIYFDRATQARLWARLAGLLAPGGLLCIGHSERIDGPARGMLESAGITAYRRTETPLPPDERTDP